MREAPLTADEFLRRYGVFFQLQKDASGDILKLRDIGDALTALKLASAVWAPFYLADAAGAAPAPGTPGAPAQAATLTLGGLALVSRVAGASGNATTALVQDAPSGASSSFQLTLAATSTRSEVYFLTPSAPGTVLAGIASESAVISSATWLQQTRPVNAFYEFAGGVDGIAGMSPGARPPLDSAFVAGRSYTRAQAAIVARDSLVAADAALRAFGGNVWWAP